MREARSVATSETANGPLLIHRRTFCAAQSQAPLNGLGRTGANYAGRFLLPATARPKTHVQAGIPQLAIWRVILSVIFQYSESVPKIVRVRVLSRSPVFLYFSI
jgi:hypothetical protein